MKPWSICLIKSGGLRQQVVEIGGRIDRIRASGHRGFPFEEM